jgi:hypothetical protein
MRDGQALHRRAKAIPAARSPEIDTSARRGLRTQRWRTTCGVVILILLRVIPAVRSQVSSGWDAAAADGRTGVILEPTWERQ